MIPDGNGTLRGVAAEGPVGSRRARSLRDPAPARRRIPDLGEAVDSLIFWLVVRSGLGIEAVRLPEGGRAPGWRAGLTVAHRQQQ